MSMGEDIRRFTSAARTVVGYQAFYRQVEKEYDTAVRVALYGSREERDVAAGRAQAWREVLNLLKPPAGV